MSDDQLKIENYQLPEGYKQTEFGVIPEDWDVQSLIEICIKIQDGTHFSPSLGGNDYLYVTSKNIGRGTLDVSNAGKIDAVQHRAIFSRCDVRKGDLLLTKDGVNTGNAALNSLDEEFSLLSSVAFLRFDTRKYEPGYFLQQVLSSDGQRQIKELMVGNAITRLTLEKIRKLRFLVPDIEEQRSLAQALSDVDRLIAALEKAIAKKRAIKTATMQQLLTGKKRLPGFGEGKGDRQTEIGLIPEDWEVKAVGAVCDFIVPGRNKPRTFKGDIPWITTPDLEDGRGVSKSKLGLFVSRDEAKSVGSRIVPTGSILMSCVGELGIVALVEREIVINQQLHAFIPSEAVDSTFLLNALQAQKAYMLSIATITAVPYLNKDNCNSIPIGSMSSF